jgi:hypothetical protein
MTIPELLAYVLDGDTIALLFFILVGGWKRYWVWGWAYEEQRARIRDLERRLERAEQLAVGGTALARRATTLAERTGAPDG